MTGSCLAPVGNVGNSPVYIDMEIVGDCESFSFIIEIAQIV